jgi:hypothetical protein
MKQLRFLLCSVFLLIVGFAGGQSLTDTVQIREIQVLAKRKVEEAGLKITRPDSLQLVSFLTTDLSELLSDYSPVFIKSYGRGSSATASFRGTAATHTQVLWNGMNLNSPMRGMADLSLLPVFFTDEVYLLHGGSSMTKGSGALGGSIHLENSPDWSSAFNLEGLAETGSFYSRKGFLKVKLGGRQFQSSTRLFYDGSENDFPFYNSGVIPKRTDTLKNAEYWKAGILQEFYLRHFNDQVSSLRLWFQKSDRNLPQLMSYQGSAARGVPERWAVQGTIRLEKIFRRIELPVFYRHKYYTAQLLSCHSGLSVCERRFAQRRNQFFESPAHF